MTWLRRIRRSAGNAVGDDRPNAPGMCLAAKAFERTGGVRPGAVVWHAGAGPNRVQIVTDDVGDCERNGRADAGCGEPSALHLREMTPHGVEGVNVGPRP